MVVFGKRERERERGKKKLTESVNTVLIKHENYTLSTSYKWNLKDWIFIQKNLRLNDS